MTSESENEQSLLFSEEVLDEILESFSSEDLELLNSRCFKDLQKTFRDWILERYGNGDYFITNREDLKKRIKFTISDLKRGTFPFDNFAYPEEIIEIFDQIFVKKLILRLANASDLRFVINSFLYKEENFFLARNLEFLMQATARKKKIDSSVPKKNLRKLWILLEEDETLNNYGFLENLRLQWQEKYRKKLKIHSSSEKNIEDSKFKNSFLEGKRLKYSIFKSRSKSLEDLKAKIFFLHSKISANKNSWEFSIFHKTEELFFNFETASIESLKNNEEFAIFLNSDDCKDLKNKNNFFVASEEKIFSHDFLSPGEYLIAHVGLGIIIKEIGPENYLLDVLKEEDLRDSRDFVYAWGIFKRFRASEKYYENRWKPLKLVRKIVDDFEDKKLTIINRSNLISLAVSLASLGLTIYGLTK